MLGLKLNHVSKRGHRCEIRDVFVCLQFDLYFTCSLLSITHYRVKSDRVITGFHYLYKTELLVDILTLTEYFIHTANIKHSIEWYASSISCEPRLDQMNT